MWGCNVSYKNPRQIFKIQNESTHRCYSHVFIQALYKFFTSVNGLGSSGVTVSSIIILSCSLNMSIVLVKDVYKRQNLNRIYYSFAYSPEL